MTFTASSRSRGIQTPVIPGRLEYDGNTTRSWGLGWTKRTADQLNQLLQHVFVRCLDALKAGRTIVAIHVDAVQKQDMEDQRAQVARFLGDISASSTGGWYSVISLHGGGSPQAMKREIFRRYPIEERRALVERLLDRGLAETGSSGAPNRQKQPGQCCATGCQPPAGQDS